jgi:hypothetical protein
VFAGRKEDSWARAHKRVEHEIGEIHESEPEPQANSARGLEEKTESRESELRTWQPHALALQE